MSAAAALMRFGPYTNYDGTLITNTSIVVRTVGNPAIDAGGNVTAATGLPTRIMLGTDGMATNTLQAHNYFVTNSLGTPAFFNKGYAFRAPEDFGPTIHSTTEPGVFLGGMDYYLTLQGGTNSTPTANGITNALGYIPLPPSATNGYVRLLQVTNVAAALDTALSNSLYALSGLSLTNAFATNAAGVTYSGGRIYISTNYDALGAALAAQLQAAITATNIATNFVFQSTNSLGTAARSNALMFAGTNLVTITSNGLASAIGSAGISALTATNIAANQVFLGTNGFSSIVFTNPSQVLMTNRLPALTNGFVDSNITNNSATKAYAQSLTNGFIDRPTGTNITFSQALPAMNVLSNGAGGGSTDDTTALQAILNRGGNISFPPTNYTTQPLWLTNNTRIFGSGARLILKPGSTNAGIFNIAAGVTNVVIENITLDGSYYAAVSSWSSRSVTSNRMGINCYINSSGSRIQNVTTYGFDKGIAVFGDQDGLDVFRKGNIVIDGCECYSNFFGFYPASSTSDALHAVEYFKPSRMRLHDNTVNFYVGGGNIGVTGNEIEEGFIGVMVEGNAQNGAHSFIAGNHINHNTGIGILLANVTQGEQIYGNEILATGTGVSILISNSVSVSVFGNNFGTGANVIIGASGIAGSSKGPNFIHDNFYSGVWGTNLRVFDWNNFSNLVTDNTTNAQHWGNYSYTVLGDLDPYRWNPYNTNAQDGSFLTSLNASQLTSGTVPQSVLPSVVVTNTEANVSLVSLGVTNSFGITNNYLDLWFSNGAHLRTNTIAPFDTKYENTNGTITWGTNGVSKTILTKDGVLLVQNLEVAVAAAQSGKSNLVFIDSLGFLRTNDLGSFVAAIIAGTAGGNPPITNAYATNLPISQVIGQRIYIGTNYDIAGGSNFLFGVNAAASNALAAANSASSNLLSANKLDKTNGFATGLTSSNTAFLGNVSFGRDGTDTNIIATTNVVGFYLAGTSLATNGAFIWNSTLGCYTNWVTSAILTNNSTAWLMQTNGVSLYSLAGASPFGVYSAVSGTGTPLGVPGVVFDHNRMVDVGFISATNINFQITNAIAVATNNLNVIITNGTTSGSIAVQNGFGTNTTLQFGSAAWGSGSTVNGSYSAVLSGQSNSISLGHHGIIAGGQFNSLGNNAEASILGGLWNSISSGSDYGFIGGGRSNNLTLSSPYSAIIGGFNNTIANAGGSTHAGNTIVGGQYNTIARSTSLIPSYSSILNGQSNFVSGSFSVASGRNISSTNDGVFVFSDGSPTITTTNSQALIQATNGLYVNGPIWHGFNSTNGGAYFTSNTVSTAFSLYAVTNSMPNFSYWMGESNGILVTIYYSNNVAFMKNNWP